MAVITMGKLLTEYPNVTYSEMAADDMKSLLETIDSKALASLNMCLKHLNGLKAQLVTDIPRDGINFNFRGGGLYGGMICKDGKYDLYS